MLWTGLAVFVGILVFDVLWTQCVSFTARGNAAAAATVGSVMYLASSFVTYEYVHDPIYVIPAILGGWIGTYYGVVLTRWRNENSER